MLCDVYDLVFCGEVLVDGIVCVFGDFCVLLVFVGICFDVGVVCIGCFEEGIVWWVDRFKFMIFKVFFFI